MGGKRLFGAIVAAAALFFFWPVLIGGWQSVSALKASRQERQDLLAKRQEIFARVAVEDAEFKATMATAAGQNFAAVVPVRKSAAELVSAIEMMTSTAGLELGELRTVQSTTKKGESYDTLSLGMDLRGSYGALENFLRDLEQYVRVLNVDAIEAAADPQSPGRLRFTVRADAYFITP